MAYTNNKRNTDRYNIDMGYGVKAPMDPNNQWYNLGSMIGGAFARNYAKRGVDKATQAGQELLDQYDANKMAQYKQAMIENDAKLKEFAERYAKNPTASVLDTIKSDPNAIMGVAPAQQPINPQVEQLTAQYDNAITPLNTFNWDAKNPANFRTDDFKARFYKDQQSLGRPDTQIDQAWNNLQAQINARDKEGKLLRANNAIDELANLYDANNPTSFNVNNPAVMKQLVALSQENPDLFKMYAGNLIGNKQLYAKQIADERYRQQISDRRMLMAEKEQQIRYKRRAIGKASGLDGKDLDLFVETGVTKGAKNNVGAGGKQELPFEVQQAEKVIKMYKDVPSDELSEDDKSLLANANQTQKKYYSGLFNVEPQFEIDGQLKQYITEYNQLRKDKGSVAMKDRLAKDKELHEFLKSNSKFADEFNRAIGYIPPYK